MRIELRKMKAERQREEIGKVEKKEKQKRRVRKRDWRKKVKLESSE